MVDLKEDHKVVVSLAEVVPVDQVAEVHIALVAYSSMAQHPEDLFLPDQVGHVLNAVDTEVEGVHYVLVPLRERVPFPVTEWMNAMNDPFHCFAFVSFSRDEYFLHHHHHHHWHWMRMYLDGNYVVQSEEVAVYWHCYENSD